VPFAPQFLSGHQEKNQKKKKKKNMVKYSKTVIQKESSVKAKGANLRVSFKNTLNTANVLRGKSLARAMAYLKNVIEHKEAVPFRKYKGGVGRAAQANNHRRVVQVRWPEKSCRFLLSLLQNLESNAEYKQLDTKRIRIKHIRVMRAQQSRRRVFRAHGRINGHLRQPCHIEVIGTMAQQSVARKLKEKKAAPKKKKAPAAAAVAKKA
jgi:large subunit ribosomal protein L17e